MSLLKTTFALLSAPWLTLCTCLEASEDLSGSEVLSYITQPTTCKNKGPKGPKGERGERGKEGRTGATGPNTQQFKSLILNNFNPYSYKYEYFSGDNIFVGFLEANPADAPPALFPNAGFSVAPLYTAIYYEQYEPFREGFFPVVLNTTFNIPVDFVDGPGTTSVIVHFLIRREKDSTADQIITIVLQDFFAANPGAVAIEPNESLYQDKTVSTPTSKDNPYFYYTVKFDLKQGYLQPGGFMNLFLWRGDYQEVNSFVSSVEFRYLYETSTTP